jgi:MoxR-like ATPase
MSSSFSPDLHKPVRLDAHDSWPKADHLFDDESVWAVQTALAIGRPLLLRGEPGIGKSQLARAVAAVLDVPFLYHVVDERCERDDLLYTYDAVARLAEAQVAALTAKESGTDWRKELDECHFVRPGVLWWAFNWKDAADRSAKFHERLHRTWNPPKAPDDWPQAAPSRPCGPVVLIDEIDKADPSVPNGLLECLGNEGFHTAQLGHSVRLAEGAKPPLIILTTNEERELPAAFLRRCLVLHLRFPMDREAGIEFLVKRATALRNGTGLSEGLCRKVADCIVTDRSEARSRTALPGAAEYLELLRALHRHAPNDEAAQIRRLEQIKAFVLSKHDPVTG